MTDGASASKANKALKVETGKWHQFVAESLELLIRLDIDPSAAASLDDVFTLESSDGAKQKRQSPMLTEWSLSEGFGETPA